MVFERPVTFLVGENGSGKSTLVEAFAEAWGLDARGGRAGRKYVNDRPRTVLGDLLRWETTPRVPGTRAGRGPSAGGTSCGPRRRSGSWKPSAECAATGKRTPAR
ncbi:AAA family ATPase [Saccharothrix isguenensis]